jgi:hypothetical protein
VTADQGAYAAGGFTISRGNWLGLLIRDNLIRH